MFRVYVEKPALVFLLNKCYIDNLRTRLRRAFSIDKEKYNGKNYNYSGNT